MIFDDEKNNRLNLRPTEDRAEKAVGVLENGASLAIYKHEETPNARALIFAPCATLSWRLISNEQLVLARSLASLVNSISLDRPAAFADARFILPMRIDEPAGLTRLNDERCKRILLLLVRRGGVVNEMRFS